MNSTFKKLLKDPYFKYILILFLIGSFLRLYRLPEFLIFLGDQGRDASIIRDILTLEHLPAIGAPTSFGHVYLGPFYYYFIAPWLLLFQFNPVGLAYGVAFFSSLFIPAFYYMTRSMFDKKIGLFATILLTFSYPLIELSRFSWNPNLLPLFSFISIFFLYQLIKTQQKKYAYLTGAFLSFSIQLHYLSLFFIPAVLLVVIYYIAKKKSTVKNLYLLHGIGSFTLFSIPLLIFDLRHQFLNVKNFLNIFSQTSEMQSNFVSSFLSTFGGLTKFALEIEPSNVILTLILIGLLVYVRAHKKHEASTHIIWTFFFVSLLGFALYSGPKFSHYYSLLYPLYYVVVAIILSRMWLLPVFAKAAVVIILTAFIFVHASQYNFLTERGGQQLEKAQDIAHVIYDNSSGEYRLTSLPERYSESTYRYFLELWGRPPLNKDSLEQTETLFVTCDTPCTPIGDPQWDVALFAPTAIEQEWNVKGTTIYKLTR